MTDRDDELWHAREERDRAQNEAFGWKLMFAALIAAGLLLQCAGCSQPSSPAPAKTTALAAPRLIGTVDLPLGDGRLHIVNVPTDFMESTRCAVAIGPSGNAAVSCASKGFDPPAGTD